ncbi:hypothetical protein NDU88_001221 [Pleurodeles waltl]|uniref:Uncharacterized protein n=1 Tax=Pleurodeles waltl TaxID=8319 RepID=A0AAV7L961_PLEWA|nr:hypothetical protein NDU88_001221 [Pleurodeles waltl]
MPGPELGTNSSTPTNAKLDQILNAITATRQDLGARVDALATALGLLKEDQPKLADHITHTENELSEMHHSIMELVG